MAKLFEDLGLVPPLPIPSYCDNINSITMKKNSVFHSWSKYIDQLTEHHYYEKEPSVSYHSLYRKDERNKNITSLIWLCMDKLKIIIIH